MYVVVPNYVDEADVPGHLIYGEQAVVSLKEAKQLKRDLDLEATRNFQPYKNNIYKINVKQIKIKGERK